MDDTQKLKLTKNFVIFLALTYGFHFLLFPMYVRGRRYGYTRQHNSGYEIIHKKEEHEQQQNVKLGLPPPSLPPKHTDFPGLKELVEETASNSDDEEFYRQLDKRVKFINNQYSVMRENTSAQKDKYKP
ncbi:hypothetical protein E2C01_065189 [Portunus trituberculatus]|uniref:Transmembrane protein n=1 Tax=Portunus trituberculatus TaxID=210409 RepID=A0A5B7HLV6_PORTR|nr:hypothetical protein [Portunus trituberculatus]